MSRQRWVMGLAVVLAVAALGGAARRHLGERALVVGGEVSAAVTAAPIDAAASTNAEASTPPRLAAAASGTQDRLRAPATAASALAQGMEICGVGVISEAVMQRVEAGSAPGQAGPKEIEAQVQRRVDASLARIAARLAAGTDRQQVAARLLMQDRDGAAMLAERSSDAQAYQLALTACGAASADVPHCARLNPRRWAELDPSDARPWLRMMEAARRRKDAAGADAALAQAAARPGLSRGSFLLEAQAAAVADVIPDADELGLALVAVIGMDAAMPGIDMGAPASACRGDALRDPVRLGHCRALARQSLANASDLLDATLAQRLAERVGVPREQQAYDAATLKAAEGRFAERATNDVGMGCAALRRIKQLSTKRAASGELAMALALLPPHEPASGPSR
ncbi:MULTISPECIES: hypothetical protein [unclassified Roseateles]|uniref:hypothetical protein n=1 Tax=unclassified Roseateles TaxID=2626991 RepID=UPI0006F75434|nr:MULTISPECIES: hypothetical protein [unclassified Roseateles]KQW49797.1 hypothetical protein ASC81_25160 [Pelomonas sp. Root405]KRA76464.1 hypothetical protein ASD88_25115 [Pelomonas sp. Root662]